MKKALFIKLTTLLIFCWSILLLNSCDSDEKTIPVRTPQDLTDMIYAGSLLVGSEPSGDDHILHFETGKVVLSSAIVEDIQMNRSEWQTTLHYTDGSTVEIPTLGNSIEGAVRKITVDPTGFCPFAAEIRLSFPVPGRVRAIVHGKHGPQGDIEHLFPLNSASQVIHLLGLYEDFENTVTLIFTDKEGNERLRTTEKVTTSSLTDLQLVKISVATSVPEKMEPGLTLVAYLGANEFDTHCPFMLDCDGEIRWALSLKSHPEIGNIQIHTGLKRMRNGNLLCGDIKTGRIIEIDMLADVKNIWDIHALGYDFHHEVIEKPNGNFLILVDGKDSKLASGQNSVEDIIIELDRETGKVITTWDLKQSLDETHYAFIDETDIVPEDWAHSNALLYSEEDDCIVVSTRFQGLIKLDKKNNVKWILAPHKNWKKNLSGYLLDPLNGLGEKITDVKVKEGDTRTEDFEWSWGGHSPVFMPNGNILLFDNGYYRHYQGNYSVNFLNPGLYSRAVEYNINETQKTVRQIWKYGEERKRECWAIAVSSAQYLPEKDHVLFCPGVGAITSMGIGGKIIEVDKASKEVVYEVDLATPAVLVFHRATRMELYP